MKSRHELNEENYQQAVKFAEHLPEALRVEYLTEANARRAFEEMQAVENSQNFAKKRPLAGTVLLLIAAISALFYWQTGRYQIVQKGEQMHQAFQLQAAEENSNQKNDRYITSLQERLRANPNNGELWYELGQAYALSNDFKSALVCYDNAQKVLGEKAAILGAMATADYYDNGQKLSTRAKGWIEQALALDPKESASLLLLASDGFLNNNYQQALDNWRKVLDSENASIDRRAIIQSMQIARQMLEQQTNE